MTYQEYKRYLTSETWNELRKARFEIDGYECYACKSPIDLQVHHLTYARLGNEDIGDLLTLCKHCHERYHIIEKLSTEIRERDRIAEEKKQQEDRKAYEQAIWNTMKQDAKRVCNEFMNKCIEKDYCRNGPIDLLNWTFFDLELDKIIKEHSLSERTLWFVNKLTLREYVYYQRLLHLKQCKESGLTKKQVMETSLISKSMIRDWYDSEKLYTKIRSYEEMFNGEPPLLQKYAEADYGACISI